MNHRRDMKEYIRKWKGIKTNEEEKANRATCRNIIKLKTLYVKIDDDRERNFKNILFLFLVEILTPTSPRRLHMNNIALSCSSPYYFTFYNNLFL